MHTVANLARLAGALTLACALAACGGGSSSGGGFSGTAAGSQKTETPTQPAASDNADVRYAP
ncbi:hypothetical protein J7E70_32740 [Variovorax paradoxus]|nr:hypothetical protein [Variovorax paradoxus]MBT2305175.1 hypothetical protein [Variovorax paradoxus]